MIEINLNKATKNFGFKNILNGFNFEVNTNEKVALIGPNGCGKSTVLKILNKEEYLDSGNLSIRKDAKIGLLPQIPPKLPDDYLVMDVLEESFKDLKEIEEKMKDMEKSMNTEIDSNKMEKLCAKYCTLQQTYEKNGGYEQASSLGKICAAFKIDDDMLLRNFNTLSGGEKTIVYLASLILSNPTILLLDEPTNHLDIDTLEWLENYLKSYNKTIVIVSHDRYFLDKVTNKTILIENGKDEIYFGNYSYYLEEHEKRALLEFEKYKDQQKMIEAMKAKIKKLQEFGHLAAPEGGQFYKRAASIQKRLDKIEVLDKPDEKKDLPLDFKIEHRSGKDVLVAKKLSLTIANKKLLINTSLKIMYGEKVCLMGKNGSGKSTLIKYLLGLNDAVCTSEILKIGSNVKIGYIPQEVTFDFPKRTVLDTAKTFFYGQEAYLRAALSKFLFYGDEVFKTVENLSGGEKIRLKLFELLQTQANFIILDEPTNHIDIDTKELLEESLSNFEGTVLFISHDRYFINKLAKRVVYIENKKLVSYVGNYDYYKEKRQDKIYFEA